MVYVKTFLISAPTLGTLYWLATRGGPRPLALWPDTFIMGAFTGLLACVIVFQWRHSRYVWSFFPRVARMIWTHRRQGRTR